MQRALGTLFPTDLLALLHQFSGQSGFGVDCGLAFFVGGLEADTVVGEDDKVLAPCAVGGQLDRLGCGVDCGERDADRSVSNMDFTAVLCAVLRDLEAGKEPVCHIVGHDCNCALFLGKVNVCLNDFGHHCLVDFASLCLANVKLFVLACIGLALNAKLFALLDLIGQLCIQCLYAVAHGVM